MSIITVKLFNFKFGAQRAASQMDPSLHSPSPSKTKTLLFNFFKAIATPIAENHIPRLPVENQYQYFDSLQDDQVI